MPSKNLTFRIKEKEQAIINALLKLNKENFFPKNIDNKTALLTLLIDIAGQKLLDVAHEGGNFDQAMNDRLYLSKQELNSIHLIHNNSKRMLYMLTTLMNGTLPNGWLETKDDFLQSFAQKGTLSRQTLQTIDNQLQQDQEIISKQRNSNNGAQKLTDA